MIFVDGIGLCHKDITDLQPLLVGQSFPGQEASAFDPIPAFMWSSFNHGRRTAFLKEDPSWIKQMAEKFPSMEYYYVLYPTRVHQWKELMKIGLRRPCQEVTNPRLSKCCLVHKGFPAGINDMEWDLTMVDTTTACHENAPGRMTAIYTVGPNLDNVILPFVRNMYQSNYYVKSSTQFTINPYYYFSQKLIKRCH
ncbi:hypothetical protein MLD38_001148 [Melastoma candidum]|uniref:Uncharacterized protein n=1 Tax=Melastoma candidum TaxID=119954 RepID=A0ACB9SE97_9MYRT|nr:hypothetical protein MLD38_001148 [Melastoma candidum]